MKMEKRQGRQGDILFRKLPALPANAVAVERKGAIVVAHSETGHNHEITALDTRHFEDKQNPLICYLQLGDDACDVIHLRGWDTHETLRLLGKPGTVWEGRRQREHTPEGWRRVAD